MANKTRLNETKCDIIHETQYNLSSLKTMAANAWSPLVANPDSGAVRRANPADLCVHPCLYRLSRSWSLEPIHLMPYK